jgi:hypothetical protein
MVQYPRRGLKPPAEKPKPAQAASSALQGAYVLNSTIDGRVGKQCIVAGLRADWYQQPFQLRH